MGCKIEVLDETPNTSNGAGGLNSELEASPAVVKLLKGIEKSYDKGKKILDECKKWLCVTPLPSWYISVAVRTCSRAGCVGHLLRGT